MNRSEKETDSLNLFHNFPIKYTSKIPVLTFHLGNSTEQRSSLMQNNILLSILHEV